MLGPDLRSKIQEGLDGTGFYMSSRTGFSIASLLLFVVGPIGCSSFDQDTPTTGNSRSDGSELSSNNTVDGTGSGASASTAVEPKAGWGDPVAIGARVDEFGGEMSRSVVAMNEQGDAIAAWDTGNEDADPPKPRVSVALYQGHAWLPPIEFSDHYGRDAKVAINDRGDLIVSYARLFPGSQGWSEEVWVRRFVEGRWVAPERVGFERPSEALMSTYVGAVEVELSNDGEALVVWRQTDTRTPAVHQGLFANYFANGRWGAPLRIDQKMPSFVDTFSVDLNAAGKGQVLWLDQVSTSSADDESASQRRVVWSKSIDRGSWGQSRIVSSASVAEKVDHASPRVAVDGAGMAYAVYLEGNAGKVIMSKVQYAELSAGDQSWSPVQTLLHQTTTTLSLETGVAVSDSGWSAVAWRADSIQNPERSAAFLGVFDPSKKGWGDIIEVSEHDSGVQSAPLLNVDARGDVWAAWRQSDADPKASIHARRFVPGKGLGEMQRPAHGESLDLAGNQRGQVCLVTRHHHISQSPLGYFSAPVATLFTP